MYPVFEKKVRIVCEASLIYEADVLRTIVIHQKVCTSGMYPVFEKVRIMYEASLIQEEDTPRLYMGKPRETTQTPQTSRVWKLEHGRRAEG